MVYHQFCSWGTPPKAFYHSTHGKQHDIVKTSWILLAKRLIFESWHHFRKLLGLSVHNFISKIRIVIPSSQREWWQTRRCAWIFVVVQSFSHVWLFANPWTAAYQAPLSSTISQSLWKLMSIESLIPPNHHILCHYLLLLPSVFPRIRVFSRELALHIRWPKYWSFSSTSFPLMNIQDWFPLGWTGLISLQSKGLLRVCFNTTVQKHQFFSTQPSLWSTSHIHTWLLEEP